MDESITPRSYGQQTSPSTSAAAMTTNGQHEPERGGGGGGDRPAKKQRRARLVTSCTACVKRKTKCDKTVPCEACVKRGQANECHVESTDDPAALRQPFALSQDLVQLQDRVKQLEQLVTALVGNGGGGGVPMTANHVGAHSPASSSTTTTNTTLPLPMVPSPTTATTVPRVHAAEDEANVAHALQTLKQGQRVTRIGDQDRSLPRATNPSNSHKRIYCFENGLLPTGDDDIDSLLSLLPPQTQSQMLVDSFYKRVDWVIHVVNRQVFQIEFDQFWNGLKQPELHSDNIDDNNDDDTNENNGHGDGRMSLSLDWIATRLATILAILGLGLHFSPSTDPTIHLLSLDDTFAFSIELIKASEKSLTKSDWAGKPRTKSVETILLICWFYWSLGELDRLIVWVGAAVRIAQSLGLHMVGSNKSNLNIPADDIDLSKLSENGSTGGLYREQLACRLWWTLCSLDWDISYRCRNTTVIRFEDFTTPVPLNYNDSDLFDDTRQPNPFDVPTSSSFQIVFAQLLQFIQQWKQPRRLPLAQRHITDVHLSWETVTKLHDTLFERIKKLPSFFRLDYSGVKPVPPTSLTTGLSHQVELQRLLFHKDIQVRLVRMTRRYMFAGPSIPEQSSTRTQARNAGLRLLSLIDDICLQIDYAAKLWWIGGYTLQACACLLCSNIHTFLTFTTIPSCLVSTIDVALTFIQQSLNRLYQISSSCPQPLREYVVECCRIISGLIVEEEYSRLVRTNGWSFDHVRHSRMLDGITKASMSCSTSDRMTLNDLASELETFLTRINESMSSTTTSNGLINNNGNHASTSTNTSQGLHHTLSTMRTTSTDQIPTIMAPHSYPHFSHPHHQQQQQQATAPQLYPYLAMNQQSQQHSTTSTTNLNEGETGPSTNFPSMTIDDDEFFRSLGFSSVGFENTYNLNTTGGDTTRVGVVDDSTIVSGLESNQTSSATTTTRMTQSHDLGRNNVIDAVEATGGTLRFGVPSNS
ncbi:hypothetical protein OIO90_003842 [Microbotryomycetes sp. JL221]|nr:hypothetical protein OIO90_003842 [Microbotryomycetes sp. JL221]